MLFIFLTLIMVCTGGCLWWLLARAQQQNADLQAEVIKLRGRLRALRH